jgi:hypothetical protein
VAAAAAAAMPMPAAAVAAQHSCECKAGQRQSCCRHNSSCSSIASNGPWHHRHQCSCGQCIMCAHVSYRAAIS